MENQFPIFTCSTEHKNTAELQLLQQNKKWSEGLNTVKSLTTWRASRDTKLHAAQSVSQNLDEVRGSQPSLQLPLCQKMTRLFFSEVFLWRRRGKWQAWHWHAHSCLWSFKSKLILSPRPPYAAKHKWQSTFQQVVVGGATVSTVALRKFSTSRGSGGSPPTDSEHFVLLWI